MIKPTKIAAAAVLLAMTSFAMAADKPSEVKIEMANRLSVTTAPPMTRATPIRITVTIGMAAFFSA